MESWVSSGGRLIRHWSLQRSWLPLLWDQFGPGLGPAEFINCVISDRRMPLLVRIPLCKLCKSRELSPREYSMSQLCSIRHNIPVTLHTPGAYGQWSVFDTMVTSTCDGNNMSTRTLHCAETVLVENWFIIATGYSVWLHLVAPFGLPCGPTENVSVFHGTVFSGAGSLETLAFNSSGPCTWLLVTPHPYDCRDANHY